MRQRLHRATKTCCSIFGMFSAIAIFGVASAQGAQPEWGVEGNTVTSNLTINLSAEAESLSEVGKVYLMLTTTALGPLWISCAAVEGKEFILHGAGTANGTLSYSKCTTYIKSGGTMKAAPACKPQEPINAAVKMEVALHEEVTYIKATGTGTGGQFTTIALPEGCSLEGTYPITGTFWLADGSGSLEEEVSTHLLDEVAGPTKALGGLTFGKSAMTIDGSANVKIKVAGKEEGFFAIFRAFFQADMAFSQKVYKFETNQKKLISFDIRNPGEYKIDEIEAPPPFTVGPECNGWTGKVVNQGEIKGCPFWLTSTGFLPTEEVTITGKYTRLPGTIETPSRSTVEHT